MRLFVQTFEVQVRTWFRGLLTDSIATHDDLEATFFRQWGEKKDHLYYLTEFGALRKKSSETVSEFIQRLNKLYSNIPSEVKPSQAVAKVTFAGEFDSDFTLLIRENRDITLARIQDDDIDIKSNMMASRKLEKIKKNKKVEVGIREPRRFKEQGGPSSSRRNTQEEKMEEMDKIIKYLSNKISRMEMEKDKHDPYVRNQNQFRRNLNTNPQIQKRQINNEEQNIQAPFKTNNFIHGDDVQEYDELDEETNNFRDDDSEPHLTQQDYEQSLNFGSLFDEQNINNFDEPTSQYKYLVDLILVELHNKYDLRPIDKIATSNPSKNVLEHNKINEGLVSKPPTEALVIQTKHFETKETETKKLENKEVKVKTKELEKSVSTFNMENELNKIKILVPLIELAKNLVYKKRVSKVINFSNAESQFDVINMQDEHPMIMFGPHIENDKDSVAPFYIALTMHDHLLHNCMLDSGASHNLMPKIIMEKLGLELTRPYQDLYSFDSRKVKCLGMIKDLVVNLAQVPVKSILMDVVVSGVPAKYNILLSRYWGANLGGSVYLDMTYAMIPIFSGYFTRLYRETRLAYIVSDPQNPNNYLVYVVDQDLGNFILSIDDDFEVCTENENEKT